MIQRIWAAALFVTGLVIFATGVVIAYSPEAKADVSTRCWSHLAEHPGTSARADVRYHLARGDFSPCTQKEAEEADYLSHTEDNGQSVEEGNGRGIRKDSPGYGCHFGITGVRCG